MNVWISVHRRKDKVRILSLQSLFPCQQGLHKLRIEDDILVSTFTVFRPPAPVIKSIPICKLWFRVDVDASSLQINVAPGCKCCFFVSETSIEHEVNQVF